MDEVKEWICNNRQIFMVSILVGFLLTPFLWPFFLGIVYSTLSMAGPVFLILVGMKMPWTTFEANDRGKGKEKEQGIEPDDGSGNKADHENQKGGSNPAGKKEETKHEQQKKPETEKECDDGSETSDVPHDESEPIRDDAAEKTDTFWTDEDGKGRIARMLQRAAKAGGKGLSIGSDGMCYALTGDGYVRIGALKGYPGEHTLVAAKLKRSGCANCRVKGKYLHVYANKKNAGVFL